MSNKEKVIREQRTLEAVKKDLIGPSGKFGVIAKYLGNQIIRQGGSLYDVDYLEDPYEDFSDLSYETTVSGQDGPLVDSNKIADLEDDYVHVEGWVFDGLSRGMHIEIKYHDPNKKLTVSYKGYQVYSEIAGDLECYAPFPDWEDMIDRLYTAAMERKKESEKELQEEFKQEIKTKQLSFLHKLRLKWGL